jgi:hypothetical protein
MLAMGCLSSFDLAVRASRAGWHLGVARQTTYRGRLPAVWGFLAAYRAGKRLSKPQRSLRSRIQVNDIGAMLDPS